MALENRALRTTSELESILACLRAAASSMRSFGMPLVTALVMPPGEQFGNAVDGPGGKRRERQRGGGKERICVDEVVDLVLKPKSSTSWMMVRAFAHNSSVKASIM